MHNPSLYTSEELQAMRANRRCVSMIVKDTLWLDLDTRKLFRVPQMISGHAARTFRAHRKQTKHSYMRVNQAYLDRAKGTRREPVEVISW